MCGLEHGQSEPVRVLMHHHFHRHTELDRLRTAVDQLRGKARTLFQLHQYDNQRVVEARKLRVVEDGEAVQRPAA
ncbi:MAG: hypothetical protein CME43_15355 [Haliea sp.]|nr:hypothetical protein [Haliea sp.]